MIIAVISAISSVLNWAQDSKDKKDKDVSDRQVGTEERTLTPSILFLGDSHMKSLLVADLEAGLGGCVTHGILPAASLTTTGGHPLRAYNSAFNWPQSFYPRAAQELRVPELLSQKLYDFLIIFECTSDLTAIARLPQNLQIFMAETSGRNTLATAESALRRFSSLQKVFILGAPPRVDHPQLQFLNQHRSGFLAWRIGQSPMRSQIKHCPLDRIKISSANQAAILFSESGDGIHLRSQEAKGLFTQAVLSAIGDAYP